MDNSILHLLEQPGPLNFTDRDLAGLDLSARNLAKANLSGAHLYSARLEGANLEGANLEWANLEGANLAGANLKGAYVAVANLEGANLAGANLKGAVLYRAILAKANLAGANLERANLKGAILYGANLAGANLEKAIQEGDYLEGTYLEMEILSRPRGREYRPNVYAYQLIGVESRRRRRLLIELRHKCQQINILAQAAQVKFSLLQAKNLITPERGKRIDRFLQQAAKARVWGNTSNEELEQASLAIVYLLAIAEEIDAFLQNETNNFQKGKGDKRQKN